LTDDGQTLAAQGQGGRLNVFDLATGQQRGGDVPGVGVDDAGSNPAPLAVSPDGSLLLASYRDGTVRLWQTRQCRPQTTAAANERLRPVYRRWGPTFSAAAYSPDGRAVVVCSGDQYGRLVDRATGQQQGEPLGVDLSFPTFSPDGARVATVAFSHFTGQRPWIRLWDSRTGRQVAALISPKFLHGLAFSPDGRTLAVGGVGCTLLVDTASGWFRRLLPENTVATCLAFSPDGRRLAVAHRAGWSAVGAGLRLWDPATCQPLGEFWPRPGAVTMPRHVLFRDAGQQILIVWADEISPDRYSPVRFQVCDGSTGRPLGEPVLVGNGGRTACSADGALLAVALNSGIVQQWDTAAGKPVGENMSHPHLVTALAYSPDKAFLAVACQDQSVRLWDTATCQPVGPPLLHRSAVIGLTFARGGRDLVTTDAAGFTHTWPLPVPVADDPERYALWVQGTGGVRREGPEVVLLDVPAWKACRDELRRQWPEADAALDWAPDDAAWHDARARDAEQDGDLRAELWHLDRLLRLRPGDWRTHARRGRVYSEAGEFEKADQEYARAAEQGAGEALVAWYRHRAAVCKLLDQRATLAWYEQRLAKAAGP
jgi:WD40 repeat protein